MKQISKRPGAYNSNMAGGSTVNGVNRGMSSRTIATDDGIGGGGHDSMGADDMLKAWVNREPVYGTWRRSGLRPRDVVATIQLKKGWNDLLLKVVDHGGGWQFCCRIRKPDGTVLDGLKVQRPRA